MSADASPSEATGAARLRFAGMGPSGCASTSARERHFA